MERVSKDEYYLNIAAAVAARSTCLRKHYGAVIVKNDEVIATGYNGSPRGEANCCDKKAFMNDCYGNEFVPYVVLTEKMLSKIQSCTDIYEQVKKMTTNYRVWNNVADYLTECLNIIADKVENAKAQG